MRPLFTSFCVISCFYACLSEAFSDDVLLKAEAELRSQGFYSGPVDGVEGPAVSAAIRRFQIRQGLKATGALTPETLESLGLGAALEPKPVPSGTGAPGDERLGSKARSLGPLPDLPSGKGAPPLADESAAEGRNSNGQEKGRSDSVGRVKPRLNRAVDPKLEYGGLFAGTPYANAPLEVQAMTTRRAQEILSHRGFFRGVWNGAVSAALEEAIRIYQRERRLEVTGQLDLRTLQKMELLPGMRAAPVGRSSEPSLSRSRYIEE
jgi:peptidoglycan hydrolase-like protein with peptidoglycan-binding domain